MNVNAIFVIILIISSFTAIVSFLLKGKYYKTALALSILNIAIAVTAFFTIHFPENQCRANSYATDCGTHSGLYLLISLFNIVFGIVIWYLAFKRKDPQPLVLDSAHPITGSQLAQQGDKEGLRKFLTASGSLVTVGIIGFVVLIAVIFVVAILSV
jgi:hypothetical protein